MFLSSYTNHSRDIVLNILYIDLALCQTESEYGMGIAHIVQELYCYNES